MPLCKSCAVLPAPVSRSGSVFVAVPSELTEAAIHQWAKDEGVRWGAIDSGLIRIEIREDVLDRLCAAMANLMAHHELDEVRMMVTENVAMTFGPLEVLKMESARKLIARVQGEWLVDILDANTMLTAFQPIVSLQDSHFPTFAYECLMRAKLPNGDLVYPGCLLDTARDMGLLFHLDRTARVTAITNAKNRPISCNVFVNFNPTSIYQPEACLQSTLSAVKASGVPKEQIVFEVVESDEVTDPKHLQRILDFYRNEGFKVALDDLGSGYSSLNLLTEIRPDFVKLDMQLIKGIDSDPFKQHVARHLLELAQNLEIKTVVEGIETEAEFDWACANGADLGQGYYIGRPALEFSLPDMNATRQAA